jgi:hypothetical protein
MSDAVIAATTLVSGLAGGGLGAWLVSRTTAQTLKMTIDRAERTAVDGGRAARETLMRSCALELLRAAGRVPVEVQALGLRVTKDDRKRGYAFLDGLRQMGTGPAMLTPAQLQERWAVLVELVHDFAHAWPVLDPREFGGDSVEEQLAAGGWLPDVYDRARGEMTRYATYVCSTAVAVIEDRDLPREIEIPVLGPVRRDEAQGDVAA